MRFYNVINLFTLFKPGKWFPRNHRKNLIIDSKIAYIGSVCMAEHMRDWRDTHTKFTGGLVAKVEAARKPKYKNHVSRHHGPYDYIAVSARLNRNELYKQLLQKIHSAEKDIRLVTPYFLPPRKLLKALGNAVKRGVTVQVMMGAKSDIRLADIVSRSYLPRLFKLGIDVVLYEANLLHAKYMMVDHDWATVGSTNLDYLSLLRNKEANIIIYDEEKIAELHGHYDNDLTSSENISLDYYRRLPWAYRVLGKLGHSIRWIL